MRSRFLGPRGWIGLLFVLLLGAYRSVGQAPAAPPSRVTYQGYLVGGDGLPLANAGARAYDIVFRIFKEESGGNAIWAEQQTTTVDKGYFSVQLGEGVPIGEVSNPSAGLASVFSGAGAADRFVAVSVKGVGSNGTDLDIQPRVRLASAPFAYLAQATGRLVDPTGSDAVVATASGIAISKPISAFNLSASTLAVGSLTVSNVLTVGGAAGAASSGSGFVESSEGTLRIISGRHQWSGSGTAATFNVEPSPGYTIARIGGGRYKITFDAPFGAPPAVIATAMGPSVASGGYPIWAIVNMSTDSATACREVTIEIYTGYRWDMELWYFRNYGFQFGIHAALQYLVNADYSASKLFYQSAYDADFQFHAVGP